MTQPTINITGNYEDFCKEITQEILDLSNEIIAARKKFTIVLSGGSTPKGVYQCMAGVSFRDKFQWEKMHFFWSDERWVPSEDQKSNFRMVSEALFTKVKIPTGNIYPIQTMNGAIQDAAGRYEQTIVDSFKSKKDQFPCFDLILLGLGQDGHTASLFPGNSALLVKDHLAAPVSQKGIPEQRITLTFPVLNGAGMIFFLVSGEEKAAIVHEILEGKKKEDFPAGGVRPDQGKLCWFLDKAAASRLVN